MAAGNIAPNKRKKSAAVIRRRTSHPNRPNGDATRQKILDATEFLFGGRGYSAVSLRNIIARARVHVAAIHFRYASKEALFEARLDRRQPELPLTRGSDRRQVRRERRAIGLQVPGAFSRRRSSRVARPSKKEAVNRNDTLPLRRVVRERPCSWAGPLDRIPRCYRRHKGMPIFTSHLPADAVGTLRTC